MQSEHKSKMEITPYETVKPLVKPEQARQEWQQYQALKKALLTKEDYQRIGKGKYIKKSGFRKIAVYFGLSDEILEEEKVEREDGSFYWRIKVKVTAPNGRKSTGVGICDSRERNFAHKEHDVYATAHTRAKNRAISDMVAGGVVSAEEMGAPDHPATTTTITTPKPNNSRNSKVNEAKLIKTKSKTDLAEGAIKARSEMKEYLESAGLEPSKVSILMAQDKLKIIEQDPNENWETWTHAIEKYGGHWNSEEKHWEVPLE